MTASFQVVEPKKVKFTCSITMQLEEWIQLQEQLSGKWPSSSLSSYITDMVIEARKTFYPKYEA
jgi:hypothetical protein